MVLLITNYGKLTIDFCADEAPVTVENFLTYVDDGFYDGTIFHRVIPGFVIQGGGFDKDMVQKPTRPPHSTSRSWPSAWGPVPIPA